MSGPQKGDPTASPPGFTPGESPSATAGTAPMSRSAAERDEWRAAGEVATGLDRAQVAVSLAARRVEHAAAEGIRD